MEVDCKAVRLCIFFACVEIARVLSRIRIARAGPVTLAVTLSRISKHAPVISFLVPSRLVRISVPCSFPSSCPVHIRDVLTLISISQITGQCLLAITSILCKTCSSSVATSPSSGDIARGIHTSAFPISFRRVYNCEHEGAHIITTQYQRMQSVLYHHKAQLHVPAQCPQKLGSNSNSHLSAPPQLPPHHRKYIVVHIMHLMSPLGMYTHIGGPTPWGTRRGVPCRSFRLVRSDMQHRRGDTPGLSEGHRKSQR